MALYKFKHGEGDNLSFDKTPFHEGWCYITHTGEFYVDLNIGTSESPNNQRIQINKNYIANQGYQTEEEIQALIDTAIEEAEATTPQVTVEQTDSGAVITAIDANGTTTATITNGKDGANGESITIISATNDMRDGVVNTVTFSDGTTINIANGSKGKQGIQGLRGESIKVRSVGTAADGSSSTVIFSDDTELTINNGKDGTSAYEIALEHGFEGTEEEWLDSLVGPQGPIGDAVPYADQLQLKATKIAMATSGWPTEVIDNSLPEADQRFRIKGAPQGFSGANFIWFPNTAFNYNGRNQYIVEIGPADGSGLFNDESFRCVYVPEGILKINDNCFRIAIYGPVFLPKSITYIGSSALGGSYSDIYYAGTKAEFAQIQLGEYPFDSSATIHCSDGDIVQSTAS